MKVVEVRVFYFSFFKVNFVIKLFMTAACPESSSEAAALSSAVAELFCTTEEIWFMPILIWLMFSASDSDAKWISLIIRLIVLVLSETF